MVGLGLACATSLAQEGVSVVDGRDRDRLDAAVANLREISHGAMGVVGDVGLDETRAAMLAACPEPDILVTNNAGPTPAAYDHWDRDS